MNKDKAIEIVKSVLSHMKNQNSGADIHEVGNIRNSASMLLEILENDPEGLSEDCVKEIAERAEQKMIEFYRKKYPGKPN